MDESHGREASINQQETNKIYQQAPASTFKPSAPRFPNSHKKPKRRIPKKRKEFSEEQTYWQQKTTEISEILLRDKKMIPEPQCQTKDPPAHVPKTKRTSNGRLNLNLDYN